MVLFGCDQCRVSVLRRRCRAERNQPDDSSWLVDVFSLSLRFPGKKIRSVAVFVRHDCRFVCNPALTCRRTDSGNQTRTGLAIPAFCNVVLAAEAPSGADGLRFYRTIRYHFKGNLLGEKY